MIKASLFADAHAPVKIGRYTVVRPVGAGGMGMVYAAYDEELDRRIAVKLLRSDSSEHDQARLLREAQAMAKLSHPNVVTVHEVGTYEEQVYVAMEFVRGQTLQEWLSEGEHPLASDRRSLRRRRPRARGGPRRRPGPPRLQALERPRQRRRAGPRERLRAGPRERLGPRGAPPELAPPAAEHRPHDLADDDRDDHGDPGLHEPGAAPRALDRRQQRSILVLRRPLRGALRRPPFPGETHLELAQAVLAGARRSRRRARSPRGSAASSAAASRSPPDERWPTMDALLEELAQDPEAAGGSGGTPRSSSARSRR
ncbi:MAG: protein kinase [Myxococcales bacterium]|nr:protein kinase [Myxococcales bacterium]